MTPSPSSPVTASCTDAALLAFRSGLLAWYGRAGRGGLPWRDSPTPYRVWVSEIMLQQTQVATVVPYFQRFIARFPDVDALAVAPLAEVLRHWAGLGYYARARNLHRAAQRVVDTCGGDLPRDAQALSALPGVGRSTAGAIRALAFAERAAILDGNVRRVLARQHAVEGWPGRADVARRLWELSEQLTPGDRVADYTQAIMDLGATVCTPRRPQCGMCPVRTGCIAHASGRVADFPAARPRAIRPVRTCHLLLLSDAAGRCYLERAPDQGLWGGLWRLPEFAGATALRAACRASGIVPERWVTRPVRRHSFSHFHLDYTPVWARVARTVAFAGRPDGHWFAPGAPEREAVPAPVARLLAEPAFVLP